MVNSKPKRSKGLTILLFPILMCIFVIGFCLYVLGERKDTSKAQHNTPKKDNVSIMPIINEDQEVIYT